MLGKGEQERKGQRVTEAEDGAPAKVRALRNFVSLVLRLLLTQVWSQCSYNLGQGKHYFMGGGKFWIKSYLQKSQAVNRIPSDD